MFRSKKLAVLVAGAAAALAVGSFAFAAIPDGNGTIHACYAKDTGVLRVTDPTTNAPKACTAKEAPLDWSQSGLPNTYVLDLDSKVVPQNQVFQVASRDVPAGRYAVSAKMFVTAYGLNVPDTVVNCWLGVSGSNGGSADYTAGTVSSNANGYHLIASLSLQNDNTWFLAQSGGTVSVTCQASGWPFIVHQLKITATRVGSVDYK